MAYFQQRYERHPDQTATDQEFLNLFTQLGRFLVYTDERAPISKDNGLIWIWRNGTTNRLYIRDTTTGAWRGPVNFS